MILTVELYLQSFLHIHTCSHTHSCTHPCTQSFCVFMKSGCIMPIVFTLWDAAAFVIQGFHALYTFSIYRSFVKSVNGILRTDSSTVSLWVVWTMTVFLCCSCWPIALPHFLQDTPILHVFQFFWVQFLSPVFYTFHVWEVFIFIYVKFIPGYFIKLL